MKNNAAFYISTLLIFFVALWFIMVQGKKLEANRIYTPPPAAENAVHAAQASPQTQFLSNIERNSSHPLAKLVIQIFFIMVAARLFGYLMTKIRQPAVVGEIIAGIVLGPSLVGSMFPGFSGFLFPEQSLPKLQDLSHIGLIFFMFLIGMELDIDKLRKKAQAAVIVSHVGIIFPCLLGVALTYFLYPFYAPDNIPFSSFALFMGTAMSITAFPVLARIIQERKLMHTTIGALVITCAATGDITAWCLLALVVAIVSAGSIMGAVGGIILSLVYVAVMFFVIRPILQRLAVKYDTPESINKAVVTVVFGILFLSCFIAELFGIQSVFGAFLAGTVMPPQKEFKRIISEKLEDVSMVLLLPLFFVFTGLRTQIGLLNEPHLWGVCFLIIIVAVIGKFVGSAIAARLVGQNWRESLLIGVLMNTRGLMELIVLNIGYDLGILSPEIFTMMVLMALVTTFMAGPVINLIEVAFKQEKRPFMTEDRFHVLLSFGSPASGSRLLELAYFLNLKGEKDSSVTAVHFSPSADISTTEAEQYERESFIPIRQTALRLGVPLKTEFGVTDNVQREVIKKVKENPCDVVLVGSSREIFTEYKTGGKVRTFIHQMGCAVGVFIDRGFEEINDAALVVNSPGDVFLLKYAEKFLDGNKKNTITILDQGNIFATRDDVNKISGANLEGNFSLTTKQAQEDELVYKNYDIVITSFDSWDKLKGKQNAWLEQMPSVLVINK